jgi:hypothetical protein
LAGKWEVTKTTLGLDSAARISCVPSKILVRTRGFRAQQAQLRSCWEDRGRVLLTSPHEGPVDYKDHRGINHGGAERVRLHRGSCRNLVKRPHAGDGYPGDTVRCLIQLGKGASMLISGRMTRRSRQRYRNAGIASNRVVHFVLGSLLVLSIVAALPQRPVSAASAGSVNTDVLNLRDDAGTWANIILQMTQGEYVTVLD